MNRKTIQDALRMAETSTEAQTAHVIQIGLTALKNVFLINGGACVALLALIGHSSTSAVPAKIPIAALLKRGSNPCRVGIVSGLHEPLAAELIDVCLGMQ